MSDQPKALTISFANKEFLIRQLTLGQIETIEGAIRGQATKANASAIGLAGDIIKAAMSRDHKDVEIADLETSVVEVTDAMRKIMTFSGFELAAARFASAGSVLG